VVILEIQITLGTDAGVRFAIRCVMNSITGIIAVAKNAARPVMKITISFISRFIKKQTVPKNRCVKELAGSAVK
jgi:hypothetical protein